MQTNSNPLASILVWSGWSLLVLADFALVWKYGSNLPFCDDFEMVPVICGRIDNFAAWLWHPCAEHRVAVPRLIQTALYTVSNNDFRAGMYFNVAALAAITGGMIWVARRVRGFTSYLDVFFPLAMLHWGQWENLLWSWQVQFISSAFVSSLILILIVRGKSPFTSGAAIIAGTSLVLLPLCGANGVALVPPLAIWFAGVGLTQIAASGQSTGSRVRGAFLIACAVIAAGLVGLYFHDFRKTDPKEADTWLAIQTAGRFLTMSLGPAAGDYWPYTLFAVLALAGTAILSLIWVVTRQSAERGRAAGVFMFITGIFALAAGLGWGRANLGENYGFVSRYVTLASPLLVAVYLAFLLYLSAAVRPLMQTALLLIVGVLFVPNMRLGWEQARQHRILMASFERDLARGDNLSVLAQNHRRSLAINDWPQLAEFLRMLHDARIGQFRTMHDDPPVRELTIPVAPARVRNMDWDAGVGTALNDDPFVVFALAKPQFVHAIRLKYSYAHADGGALGEFYWSDSHRNEFSDKERRLTWTTTPGEQFRTFWINDTIDQFRFDPDNKPCVFKLEEVVLLLPVVSPP